MKHSCFRKSHFQGQKHSCEQQWDDGGSSGGHSTNRITVFFSLRQKTALVHYAV